MTRMPHLPLMRWDFKERLTATSRQVFEPSPPPGRVPETTYHVYSCANLRTRKVIDRPGGKRKSERMRPT